MSIKWLLHSWETLANFPCHALKGGMSVLGLIEFRGCLISTSLKLNSICFRDFAKYCCCFLGWPLEAPFRRGSMLLWGSPHMGKSMNQYIKIYWVLYAQPLPWRCRIGNCSQKPGRLAHKHIGRACFNLHPFFSYIFLSCLPRVTFSWVTHFQWWHAFCFLLANTTCSELRISHEGVKLSQRSHSFKLYIPMT